MGKLPVVGGSRAPDRTAEALLALDGAVDQLALVHTALVHDPALADELAEAEALLAGAAALRVKLRDRALARFGG